MTRKTAEDKRREKSKAERTYGSLLPPLTDDMRANIIAGRGPYDEKEEDGDYE